MTLLTRFSVPLLLTGRTSLVRQLTPKLSLGAEVTTAITRKLELSKGQLQALVGGKYALRKHLTLDFGGGGRFVASPRLGVQLGLSTDL